MPRRFVQDDSGDDLAMLNVIDLSPTPLPVDGAGWWRTWRRRAGPA